MSAAMPRAPGDDSTAAVPSSNQLLDTAASPPLAQGGFRRRASLPPSRARRVYRACFVTTPPPNRLAFIVLLFVLLYAGQGLCAGSVVGDQDDKMSGVAAAAAYVHYCDDASPATPPGCVHKLVVNITLDDSILVGSVLETEVTVTHALHQSLFPLGAAADAAGTDATSLQVSLPPITVAMRRGAVQVRYELNYLRTFPAALRDDVQVLRTAMSCDDGVTRCPSYKSMTGALVPAPLGLCCLCTGVECALTSDLCNASMRGDFCFRSGAAGIVCVQDEGITYDGWSVGSSSLFYTLHLSASGKGIAPTALQLTTDTPEVQDGASVLQLLQTSGSSPGEANAKVDIAGRVLFVPSTEPSSNSSGSSSNSYVRDDDPAEWLLLPAPFVSVSGNDCDRVGVSADYIYSLSSITQCNAQKGSCVRHQLADYRAEDLAEIAQGFGGRYIAASLGTFTRQMMGEQGFLLDAVQRTGGAKLRWTVNADELELKALPVHGALGAVEFVSGTGILQVTVQNENAYAGLYYIAVGHCQRARALSCDGDGVTQECLQTALVAGANASALFRFSMVSDQADEVGSIASCTVVLRDAAAGPLASKNVSWTVEHTTTTPVPSLPKAEQCGRCGFSGLSCLLRTVCEWQILVWTAMAVAIVWAPYTVLACWRIVRDFGAKGLSYLR
ncbi:hypothetical protein JIQ42_00422 [Leishmania sp. Namibia]|uniref:hypothetical protein n=1 Tax=Leishmania sp. Namibia TaxID=2802991 RepID=UPI001B571FFC|nr:hypothetical protein JIQ42_00422 [Leishmania sp. Namibia]